MKWEGLKQLITINAIRKESYRYLIEWKTIKIIKRNGMHK